MANKWLSTTEASKYLGVSARTIQRYIKQGKLKVRQIGNKTTLDKNKIEALKTGSEATIKRHYTTNKSMSPELQILKETLDTLRTQLISKDKQIDNQQKQIDNLQKRQDDILQKLTQIKQLQNSTTSATRHDSDTTSDNNENVAEFVVTKDIKNNDNVGDSDTKKQKDDTSIKPTPKHSLNVITGLFIGIILVVIIVIVYLNYSEEIKNIVNLLN